MTDTANIHEGGVASAAPNIERSLLCSFPGYPPDRTGLGFYVVTSWTHYGIGCAIRKFSNWGIDVNHVPRKHFGLDGLHPDGLMAGACELEHEDAPLWFSLPVMMLASHAEALRGERRADRHGMLRWLWTWEGE